MLYDEQEKIVVPRKEMLTEAFPCSVCPIRGGVMTRTTSHNPLQHWVHAVCSYYHHHESMDTHPNNSAVNTFDLSMIDHSRYKLSCSICQTKSGACVPCSYPGCTVSFHVGCADRERYVMRTEYWEKTSHPCIYCPLHSNTMPKVDIEHQVDPKLFESPKPPPQVEDRSLPESKDLPSSDVKKQFFSNVDDHFAPLTTSDLSRIGIQLESPEPQSSITNGKGSVHAHYHGNVIAPSPSTDFSKSITLPLPTNFSLPAIFNNIAGNDEATFPCTCKVIPSISSENDPSFCLPATSLDSSSLASYFQSLFDLEFSWNSSASSTTSLSIPSSVLHSLGLNPTYSSKFSSSFISPTSTPPLSPSPFTSAPCDNSPISSNTSSPVSSSSFPLSETLDATVPILLTIPTSKPQSPQNVICSFILSANNLVDLSISSTLPSYSSESSGSNSSSTSQLSLFDFLPVSLPSDSDISSILSDIRAEIEAKKDCGSNAREIKNSDDISKSVLTRTSRLPLDNSPTLLERSMSSSPTLEYITIDDLDTEMEDADILPQLLRAQYELFFQQQTNESHRSQLRKSLNYTELDLFDGYTKSLNSSIERAYLYSHRWQGIRSSLVRGVKDHPLPPALLNAHRRLYGYDLDEELCAKSAGEVESALEVEMEELDHYSVCCICFDSLSDEQSNPIIYCDGCNICVHTSCYGVIDIPANDWFCDYCTFHRTRGKGNVIEKPIKAVKKEPRRRSISSTSLNEMDKEKPTKVLQKKKGKQELGRCKVCPVTGGALKQIYNSSNTSEGEWCHIVCALSSPSLQIDDIMKMSPILGIDTLVAQTSPPTAIPCGICKQAVGSTICCSQQGCHAVFHPLCAWYHGLCMNVQSEELHMQYFLFCQSHTPVAVLNDPSSSLRCPSTPFTHKDTPSTPNVVPTPSTAMSPLFSSHFSFPASPSPRVFSDPAVLTYRLKIRMWQQRELRNRGRQEHWRNKKRRRNALQKKRLAREDRYEIGRCAVCFHTDEELRQQKFWNERRLSGHDESRDVNGSGHLHLSIANHQRQHSMEHMEFSLLSPITAPRPQPVVNLAHISHSSTSMSGPASSIVSPRSKSAMDLHSDNTSSESKHYPPLSPFLLPTSSHSHFNSIPHELQHMDGDTGNLLLRCDECGIQAHQLCYGVLDEDIERILRKRQQKRDQLRMEITNETPFDASINNEADDDDDTSWLCKRCTAGAKDVSCVLCPRVGGAFIRTVEGGWIHAVCARWYPELTFLDTLHRDQVKGVRTIPKALRRLQCYLCHRSGPCVNCTETCNLSFHPLCGYFSGQYMHLTEEVPGEAYTSFAYCRRHTPIHLTRGLQIPREYTLLYNLKQQMDRANTLIDRVKKREKLKETKVAVDSEVIWASIESCKREIQNKVAAAAAAVAAAAAASVNLKGRGISRKRERAASERPVPSATRLKLRNHRDATVMSTPPPIVEVLDDVVSFSLPAPSVNTPSTVLRANTKAAINKANRAAKENKIIRSTRSTRGAATVSPLPPPVPHRKLGRPPTIAKAKAAKPSSITDPPRRGRPSREMIAQREATRLATLNSSKPV